MRILGLVGALSVLSSVTLACGLTAGGDDIPDGFTAATCAQSALVLAKGLSPTNEVDFIGARTEATERDVRTAGNGGVVHVAEWSATMGADSRGAACANATDVDACKTKLANLRLMGDSCEGLSVVTKAAPMREQPSGVCRVAYWVYTRGDEVGVIRSPSEARALFGTIDSPEEAIVIAQLAGETFSCGAAAYARVDGGFDLTSSSACGRRIVRVSSDGQVSVIDDPC